MSQPIKRIATGLGVIVGVAHIGVLGHLVRLSSEPTVPVLPFPEVHDATSFTIKATTDGYEITYVGDDPKVLTEEVETDKSNGVFGLGGRTNVTRSSQFTRHGQPVRSADDEGKLTAERIACIEAAGGGRSNGAIVGSSVAATAIPFVSSIPYVGWLAAGWVTLFGGQVGGDLGAEVATIVKGC